MNYTLMAHQQKAKDKAKIFPKYAYFHDTGTGKTLLGINIFLLHQVRTLIICPLSIIEGAWIDEISTFAPEYINKTINLWALGQRRKTSMGAVQFKMGLKNCQICIVNFEGFKTFRKEIEAQNFKMLIIDESSKIKSIKSQITKHLIKYADTMQYVYLFSGNPAPNSELEYYTQVRALSTEPFGKSFYTFRNKYFYPTGYGGYKWVMKEDMRQEFLINLATFTEVVLKDDVLDLPLRTDNIRDVYLSAKEREAYEVMRKNFVLEYKESKFIAQTVVTKIMKLREITSGFIMGEGIDTQIIGKSKLNSLLELLDEIGNHQAIIWIQFHEESKMISQQLKKWGRVDGLIKQDVRDLNINKFKKGDLQYLIGHPKSMGHGHRFINCHYSIHYSFSHSYDEFKQAPDRIHRKGQTEECSMYWLIAKNTYDQVIYDCVRKKGNIVTATFDFIKGRNTI